MSAGLSAQPPRPQLPGMSLPVVPVERGHVALEVLLQLAEGAHRLIECPNKNNGPTSTERPPECWPGGSRCPSARAGNLTSRNGFGTCSWSRPEWIQKDVQLLLQLRFVGKLPKDRFFYRDPSGRNTHSLSMTRHSTPFSSARILADLTSSLET